MLEQRGHKQRKAQLPKLEGTNMHDSKLHRL
jgi:hypothetical protein